MRMLTQQEVKELRLNSWEKYILLDKEKGNVFFSSDKLEECENTLHKMTPRHPRYKHLEQVQAP